MALLARFHGGRASRARSASVALAAVLLPAGGAADAHARPALERSAPMVSVIVTLDDQVRMPEWGSGSRPRAVLTALQGKAAGSQRAIRAMLAARRAQGRVAAVTPFWIFNGLAVRATPDVVAELSGLGGVASVRPDRVVEAPTLLSASSPPEPNVALINAPRLWDLGARGQGVVVASMDTGVDAGHPDLAAQFRGGTNSWFDPYGEHPSGPTDPNGHGTATMGVVAGRAEGGSGVGMAPDATWIAVKLFDDRGVATASAIHAGFQWLLDPDGDPTTPDAPDLVNNSWTFQAPGCDLEFEPDLQALRAVGIVPVFAAGNGGPSAATSMSPANNPSALAVGATDNGDAIFSLSSRGPSACGEAETVFPELVAPGVGVRTADLFGGYRSLTGTSLAAPHVTGALALLQSSRPGLEPQDAERALRESAVDLGPPGPENDFGLGRVDVLAAYRRLGAGARPVLHLSLEKDADILALEDDVVSVLFDGSDVGVGAFDVDALAESEDGSLLLSFDRAVILPGVGRVDDSDVVAFRASALGAGTAGRFTRYFDGSDVGLAGRSEDVDALELLPDGRLLVSTSGRARVRRVRASDEDLLAFTPSSLGRRTRGTWALYLDGSDVGLERGGEDIDGVAVGEGGALYLSTTAKFYVGGLSGDDDDVFMCVASSLGPASVCSLPAVLVLDGGAFGLEAIDALETPGMERNA